VIASRCTVGAGAIAAARDPICRAIRTIATMTSER
jgi:hypothetical protein